jgi:capsular polysaccharide transport system ATP-binding protein
MSLELRNVSIRTRRTLNPVSLHDINIRVTSRDRVALLCPRTGLDRLVNVIAGASPPDKGTVIRNSSLSWPIPSGAFLHKHQTFTGNARFVARLYEVDQSSFIAKVVDVARVADIAQERLDHCPKEAVARFSFALGICLPFDIYLLTAVKIGDKRDNERYAEMIADVGRSSGLLIAAASGKGLQGVCDQAYVFDRGRAHHYKDIEAAAEHIARIAKPTDSGDDDDWPAEDERVLDDF